MLGPKPETKVRVDLSHEELDELCTFIIESFELSAGQISEPGIVNDILQFRLDLEGA